MIHVMFQVTVKTSAAAMFSKVNVQQKNTFLEQTKAQREERAHERQKEVAAVKIQVSADLKVRKKRKDKEISSANP